MLLNEAPLHEVASLLRLEIMPQVDSRGRVLRIAIARRKFKDELINFRKWKLASDVLEKEIESEKRTLSCRLTHKGRYVMVRTRIGGHGSINDISLKLVTLLLRKLPFEYPLAVVEHANGRVDHVTEFDETRLPLLVLAKRQTHSENEAMVSKVLKDVRKIHSKEVVHGDLNTNNILYNPDEKTVRFIDVDTLGFEGREKTGFFKTILQRLDMPDSIKNHKLLDVAMLYYYLQRSGVQNLQELIAKNYLRGSRHLKRLEKFRLFFKNLAEKQTA